MSNAIKPLTVADRAPVVGVCPLSRQACSIPEQTERHAPSGLRVMESPHTAVRRWQQITVDLPANCCPVSHNPRPDSTLTLRYRDTGRVLEVYALKAVLRQFVGGYPGNEHYPAERNMEGMVHLIGQMAADALGCPVRVSASLVLDTGSMTIVGRARPSLTTGEGAWQG